jgi:hypothetical protein
MFFLILKYSPPLITTQSNVERIMTYGINMDSSFVFSEEIAEAIYQLWGDPIIPQITGLMDNAN